MSLVFARRATSRGSWPHDPSRAPGRAPPGAHERSRGLRIGVEPSGEEPRELRGVTTLRGALDLAHEGPRGVLRAGLASGDGLGRARRLRTGFGPSFGVAHLVGLERDDGLPFDADGRGEVGWRVHDQSGRDLSGPTPRERGEHEARRTEDDPEATLRSHVSTPRSGSTPNGFAPDCSSADRSGRAATRPTRRKCDP